MVQYAFFNFVTPLVKNSGKIKSVKLRMHDKIHSTDFTSAKLKNLQNIKIY